MANGKIAYNNLATLSTTTITASTEATGFDAENAGNWNLYDSWKGTDSVENSLIFDLGSAQDVDYFAIFGHDLSTQSAAVSFQYSDTGTSGPWIDITNANMVSNGDFDSDVSGWAGVRGGTIIYGTNDADLTGDGITSFSGASTVAISTIIGQKYIITMDFTAITGSWVFGKTDASNGSHVNVELSASVSGSGTYAVSFIATATSTYIIAETDGIGAYTATTDNVKLKKVPADKAAIFETFANVNKRYFRLNLRDAASAPTISVISFGEHLELTKGFRAGFNPIGLIDEAALNQNISENGIPLGRSSTVSASDYVINQKNVTEAWVRSDWLPFLEEAKLHPFFVMWDETNFPLEVVFAWAELPLKKTESIITTTRLMSVSLNIKGLHEL